MDPETTKLFYLVEAGDLQGLKELVEDAKVKKRKRGSLLDAVDWEGWTVLHYAAYNNIPSIIKWLLSSEGGGGRAAGFTKILAKTVDGTTTLHLAAQRGHLECCHALVEGSDVDNGEQAEMLNGFDDKDGWTVLHYAAHNNRPSIIRWLLSSKEEGGRAAGFTSILAKESSGSTALHLAAEEGHLECCQALVESSKIENGERAELLNAVDKDGLTVLHYAVFYDYPSIIRWLLSSDEGGGRAAGFTSKDITATTEERESALHLAAYSGSVECLNALLSGCTVGERLTLFLQVDKHGWTAFHHAAQNCRIDIIRELLLRYPETQTIVDHRDHRGMTALHRAVIGGVDEESREEWVKEGEENIGQTDLVASLLTVPKKVDDKKDGEQQQQQSAEEDEERQEEDEKLEQQQASVVDPNLGTKIE